MAKSSFHAGNERGIAGPSSKAKSGPSALMLLAFGFFSGPQHTAQAQHLSPSPFELQAHLVHAGLTDIYMTQQRSKALGMQQLCSRN